MVKRFAFVYFFIFSSLIVVPIHASDNISVENRFNFPLGNPDKHYCSDSTKDCSYNQATSFLDLAKLSSVQLSLLSTYLGNGGILTNDAFLQYVYAHDDFMSAFLGITHALSHLQMVLPNGVTRIATDLLLNVDHFEGDRTMIHIDRELFSSWKDSGGNFILTREDGKTEHGNMGFDTGNLGGSLHKGYDTQGYTSRTNMPRIQINYRLADSLADIDLDAYRPWYGPIPNPHHLSWENSDIRHWFAPNYTKKFGDPGFNIFVRKVAASAAPF